MSPATRLTWRARSLVPSALAVSATVCFSVWFHSTARSFSTTTMLLSLKVSPPVLPRAASHSVFYDTSCCQGGQGPPCPGPQGLCLPMRRRHRQLPPPRGYPRTRQRRTPQALQEGCLARQHRAWRHLRQGRRCRCYQVWPAERYVRVSDQFVGVLILSSPLFPLLDGLDDPGYSGDVWNVQPAPRDHVWRTVKNPLGGGNGMVPHYSGTTLDAQERYARGTKSIIENYLAGKPQEPGNVIIGKGRYETKAYGQRSTP